MNADYPANPATPGSHPFPGVTQAAPQGSGGAESAPAPWGAGGPRMHSQQDAPGGAGRPNVPAVPPPSPFAATPAPANPATPAQHTAPQPPPPLQHAAPQPATTQHAPTQHSASQPAMPQPATPQHTTTQSATPQHTTTQHTTTPPAPGQSVPPSPLTPSPLTPSPLSPTVAAPIRRASLRTGTQALETSTDAAPVAKRFGIFGKKSEAEVPSSPTETIRRKGGPRKVRVMLTSIDPWSAMKMSFLTSIAAGIALVVAVSVLWGVLNTMGVFPAIQKQVTDLFGAGGAKTSILQYTDYSKVMSGTILVAVFNAVILTALGTISALIYNVVGKLVGGVYVTLTDD